MRRVVALGAASLAAAALLTIHGGGVAVAATNGLNVTSSTTYQVSDETGQVHVAIDLTVTNNKPDGTSPTGPVEYFFAGFRVHVDDAATNVAVTVDGQPAEYEFLNYAQSGVQVGYLDVEFGRHLEFGQTVAVAVSFDIIPSGRDPFDETRANAAFTSFMVFANGDPGKASVRVELPFSWVPDYLGFGLDETGDGAMWAFTADEIDNPDQFAEFFTARRDFKLGRHDTTTADGHQFLVRAWPGDSAWEAFVGRTLLEGLPVLEELIGIDWPETATTEIVESWSPLVRGYGGWYDAETNAIEIDDSLDRQLLLHELSHAWLNTERMTDRWIIEGFAEEYATRAMGVLGETPYPHDSVEPHDDFAIDLNEWGDPLYGGDESELFGYNASFWLADALIDEIGVEKMSEVFVAADEGYTAYPGDAPPEHLAKLLDWKRFIDLTEEYGGSTAIESLYRTWVTTEDENKELDDRTAARATYAALETAGGQWAPPTYIRTAMNLWNFSLAEDWMADARAVVDRLPELRALRDEIGAGALPTEIEAAYESATRNLDEVTRLLDAEFASARAEIARREAVRQELLRNREQTGAVIDAARDALDDADGPRERIGLWGTDLDAKLDSAEQHLAADEFDAARADVAVVLSRIDEADDIGTERLLKAGGVGLVMWIMFGLLVGVVVGSKTRRHRRALYAIPVPMLSPGLPPPPETWPPRR